MKKSRELMKRAGLVLFLLFVGILFLTVGIVPAVAIPLRPDNGPPSTSNITVKNFRCRLAKDTGVGNVATIPLDPSNISASVDVSALKKTLDAYNVICAPSSGTVGTGAAFSGPSVPASASSFDVQKFIKNFSHPWR